MPRPRNSPCQQPDVDWRRACRQRRAVSVHLRLQYRLGGHLFLRCLRALLCGSGRVSTFELATLEFLPSSRRQWRRQQRRRQLRRRQQPSADGEPTEGFSDGACGYFVGFGDWTHYGYVIGFGDGTCGYVIGFNDATCGYVTVGFGDGTYYGYAIGFGDGAFSYVIGFNNRAYAYDAGCRRRW